MLSRCDRLLKRETLNEVSWGRGVDRQFLPVPGTDVRVRKRFFYMLCKADKQEVKKKDKVIPYELQGKKMSLSRMEAIIKINRSCNTLHKA